MRYLQQHPGRPIVGLWKCELCDKGANSGVLIATFEPAPRPSFQAGDRMTNPRPVTPFKHHTLHVEAVGQSLLDEIVISLLVTQSAYLDSAVATSS
jgi:hypothetical protein